MALIDVVILAVIGVAFAAVVVRMRKKGTCGDCASAGSCSGACSSCGSAERRTCPVGEGVDGISKRLSQGVGKK